MQVQRRDGMPIAVLPSSLLSHSALLVFALVACTSFADPAMADPQNLALSKPVIASSTQSGNAAAKLTDGDRSTRWCADSPAPNAWVVVDLLQPHHLRSLRLHWERRRGTAYQYTVETSADLHTWTQVVDASENRRPRGVRTHTIDAANARFLRVNYLGSNNGSWGSLWELEVASEAFPPLRRNSRPTRQPATPLPTLDDIDAPDGFDVTLFATPPNVNYPTCVAAAATGEVFVGIDEQGSLGKEKDGGRVVRCLDTDGDGVADAFNDFAKMDHPRGIVYDAGSMWVLHPPYLTLFRDKDNDGVADQREVLIEGISTDEVNRRGADHTTNGIRLGIDGWIYIAVGDFGFHKAIAQDGTTLSRRGGGVVRIRPDGTGMEIYCWGQRNIMDVAIDPRMNMFTRDNTNDGGGWDIRLSHVIQTAHYGYPSLYKNFTNEIMPPLADFGGGSGCGVMYFQDPRWPEGFRDILLTCDWGRSEVYSHRLPPTGATFEPQQDVFLKIPRPTDIDADAAGRMFVTSWKNGGYKYDQPNVGFVTMIRPQGLKPQTASVAGQEMSEDDLEKGLLHCNAAYRLHCQREILRRDAEGTASDTLAPNLLQFLVDPELATDAKIAVLYTLVQMEPTWSEEHLVAAAHQDDLREHVVRAISDAGAALGAKSHRLLIDSLSDANPRVQAAALVAIGRTPDMPLEPSTVARILSLTQREFAPPTMEGDAWRLADSGRVLPHLAVQALVRIKAIEACLNALDGDYRDGALWALRYLHDPRAVDGLLLAAQNSRDAHLRDAIWTTLIRLYHREGEFTEDSPGWWGTRPDTTGPYYHRVTWSESQRIGDAVALALATGDESLRKHLETQLERHLVKLDQTDAATNVEEAESAVQVPTVDPDNPHQIANLAWEAILERAVAADGDHQRGQQIFQAQSCSSCHTYANGQKAKGPHLVDIGKRYSKPELIASIVRPGEKIAQGFDTWTFALADGTTETGFIVLESAETVTLRNANGLSFELLQDDIEDRVKLEVSMMPQGIAGNLTPEQLSDLIAYLQSLR